MEQIKFLDFDLLIEKVGDGYRARVLHSPAGQASTDFVLPFTDEAVENLMLRVGRVRRGVRRLESPEMQAAKQFGGKLFDAVFSSDVRGALRSSMEAANREDAGLRVRLRLAGAPELVDLPWEFLYNSSLNRFLALSNTTPLVRYIDLPETPRPLKISPPLRVLVMISSPSDFEALDVEREWQKLNDAVRDLSANNMVLLERLDVASLGGLRRKLRQEQFHVMHFIGHGGFDAQAQDGVLLLEDEQGRGRKTSGQYLGQVLTDHKSLRLVVLNACEGARTARNDPFAGVAQSLVQQGMSAVIAMQFEVTDEASITFAQEFYAALSDGYPVDAALGEARGAIFSEVSDLEWGTPVLYLRAPDGMIFAPLTEQERAERDRARLTQEKLSHEREQQIETHSLAAQASLDKKDFDAAEKSLAALLALDATNANALELQTKIQTAREQEEARKKQQKTKRLYTVAQTSFDKNDFDAAEKSLAALLALDATNANALELQTKIQTARARAAQESAVQSFASSPNRLSTTPTPTPSPVAPQGFPTRYAVPIAGAIVLLLLLFGGGLFVSGVFNSQNATPTSVAGIIPVGAAAGGTPTDNSSAAAVGGGQTSTPSSNPTKTATDTPTVTLTHTAAPTKPPSDTPTKPPTETPTAIPQSPTATRVPPTKTRTPIVLLGAPVLNAPANDAETTFDVTFEWGWTRALGQDETFQILAWQDGDPVHDAQGTSNNPSFFLSYDSPTWRYGKQVATYLWTVRVVRASNGQALSAEAAPLRFRIKERAAGNNNDSGSGSDPSQQPEKPQPTKEPPITSEH